MTPKELEHKLHTQIPLTQLMQLKIEEINDKELITTSPLDININDKGTAFGGSLSTQTIISAWSVCFLLSQKLNLDQSSIVIIKNTIEFLRPVKKAITCHSYLPTQTQIEQLKIKINNKKSGSLTIVSHIIEDNDVCVKFEGTFVIKLH